MALSVPGVITDQHRKEQTEHGSALFPIAAFDNDLRCHPVPWHWHEEWEWILITQGQVTLQLECRQITLKPGQAVLIHSEVLHSIQQGRPVAARCRSLVFHDRLIGSRESLFWQRLIAPLLADETFSGLLLDPAVPWQQQIIAQMNQAWQALAQPTEDSENWVRFQITAALGIFHRHFHKPAASADPHDRMEVRRLKTMLEFIEHHLHEPLSLKEIAASAGLSPSTCLRCFRHRLCTTPIHYLMCLRVEKAAEQLADSSQRIKDIAMRCGFSDFSYFTRCFRQLKGQTPTAYRRSFLREEQECDTLSDEKQGDES